METARQEALLEQQKRLEELKKRIPNYDKVQAIGTDTGRLQQDTVAFKVREFVRTVCSTVCVVL